MVCLVVTGDDTAAVRARKATFVAASGVEAAMISKLDLADPDQLEKADMVICGSSLFAQARLVELVGIEELDKTSIDTVVGLIRKAGPDTHVLVVAPKLTEATKKAFAGLAVENFTATAATISQRLQTLANEHKIQLDEQTLAHLQQRVGSDTGAATSVLYSMAVIGVSKATVGLIDKLSEQTTVKGTPWGVVDALSEGNLKNALALSDGVEPLAVLSFLGTRLGQAGRILESPLNTPREVAGAFGIGNTQAASKLLEHAQRLGEKGVANSWRLVAEADVAVKSSKEPRIVLDMYLVKLALLWHKN